MAVLNGADLFFKKPYEPQLLMRDLRRLTKKEQPKRLLIIDDNEVSRYILRQLLDQPWLSLCEARNGDEGLRAVQVERPDAIILDLLMPGMDGMKFLEILRSQDETRELPVIVYTSKTLSEQEKNRIEQLNATTLSKNDVAATLTPVRILNTLAAAGFSEQRKF